MAKACSRAMTRLPMVTLTWCCRKDAWITRTSALPRGVPSVSLKIWSRRPVAGPMPATVYARLAVTATLVERTGVDVVVTETVSRSAENWWVVMRNRG